MFNPADTLKFVYSRWVAAGIATVAAGASIVLPEPQYREWGVHTPSEDGWQYAIVICAGALFLEVALMRIFGLLGRGFSTLKNRGQREKRVQSYCEMVCKLPRDEQQLVWAIYRNGGILSVSIDNKVVQAVEARRLIYPSAIDQSAWAQRGAFYKLKPGGMAAMELLDSEVDNRIKC